MASGRMVYRIALTAGPGSALEQAQLRCQLLDVQHLNATLREQRQTFDVDLALIQARGLHCHAVLAEHRAYPLGRVRIGGDGTNAETTHDFGKALRRFLRIKGRRLDQESVLHQLAVNFRVRNREGVTVMPEGSQKAT